MGIVFDRRQNGHVLNARYYTLKRCLLFEMFVDITWLLCVTVTVTMTMSIDTSNRKCR